MDKPVFVVTCEAVDNDWHWQRHDEDAAESAKASNELAQERVRVQVVADSRDRHQAPPGNNQFSIDPALSVFGESFCSILFSSKPSTQMKQAIQSYP